VLRRLGTDGEAHYISVSGRPIFDGQGGFYAGSDQGGVIYHVSSDGKTSVLYDTPAREIPARSTAGPGSSAATRATTC